MAKFFNLAFGDDGNVVVQVGHTALSLPKDVAENFAERILIKAAGDNRARAAARLGMEPVERPVESGDRVEKWHSDGAGS